MQPDERPAYERQVELETRLAFQERALAQQDELVRELFGRVESLERAVASLRAHPPEPPAASGFADGLLDED